MCIRDSCIGKPIFSEKPSNDNILKAMQFLKKDYFIIEHRKMWPSGIKIDDKNKIPESYICQNGLALSSYGDAGWGRIVKQNKYVDKYFSDDLVDASAEVLKSIIDDNDIVWAVSYTHLDVYKRQIRYIVVVSSTRKIGVLSLYSTYPKGIKLLFIGSDTKK